MGGKDAMFVQLPEGIRIQVDDGSQSIGWSEDWGFISDRIAARDPRFRQEWYGPSTFGHCTVYLQPRVDRYGGSNLRIIPDLEIKEFFSC